MQSMCLTSPLKILRFSFYCLAYFLYFKSSLQYGVQQIVEQIVLLR